MINKLYNILFICFTSISISAQTWNNVGPAGFTGGLAVENNLVANEGVPYVAFQDHSESQKISVMKYDGSNWVPVGNLGFTPFVGVSPSLAFDGNTPYVAFEDSEQSGGASVMKFDGSDWVFVGAAGLSDGGTRDISLTVSNGTPYIAFRDLTSTDGFFKCTVMSFDGTNWLPVGEERFSDGQVSAVNIAIINDVPHVAFADLVDINNMGASVMKYDGNAWVYVGGGPAFSQGAASGVSMAVDNGVPYVAYSDSPNSFKLTVMKLDGNSWSPLGMEGFTSDGAHSPSLAFNNGIPYVAYRDAANDFKTSVIKFENNSWQAVGTQGFSPGDVTAINLDFANGLPYVSYQDVINAGKLSVMRYAIPNNTRQIYEAASQFVFPNPVHNVLTIKNMEEKNLKEIFIINTKGEQVKKVNRMESNSLDISDLEEGLYILQIHTEQGIINSKFVKM